MSLIEDVAAALQPLHEVRVAWVFGSQLTGRARADSDLDVAVVLAPRLDARSREDVRRRLADTLADALGALGERADILDLDRADTAVAFAVIRDGVRVVARTEAERIDATVRAWRRYDDDAPRRALYRQAAVRAGRRLGRNTRERP